MSQVLPESLIQEGRLVPDDGASRTHRKKKRQRPSDSGMKKFCELYESTDEYLGEGGCGQVRTYRNASTKKEYAVKIVVKTNCHVRCKVLREIEILHHCRGQESIVQLFEFFEEDDRFYLVFEKMEGGTLFDWLENHGSLTEQEASAVIHQITKAVDFLHSKGIAHRDLKLENILCATAGQLLPVKICDFDLSSEVKIDPFTHAPVPTPELMSPVGSVDFMAPEVIDVWQYLSNTYDKRCDLWSLGVILYILLSGYKPFYIERGPNCDCEFNNGILCNDCQDLLFLTIQEGVYSFPESEWDHISDGAKDLVGHLLVRNPQQRYATDEVLSHPWILDVNSHTMPIAFSRSSSHANAIVSSGSQGIAVSDVCSFTSNYYGSESDLDNSSPVQTDFVKEIAPNCRSITTTISESIFHMDLADDVASWSSVEQQSKAPVSSQGLNLAIESSLAKRRALKLKQMSIGSNDSGNVSEFTPPSALLLQD